MMPTSSLPPAPVPQLYVTQVFPMDVLLGRGTGPNDHLGNRIFRDLVDSRKAEFLMAHTSEMQKLLFESTIAVVHTKGGRFLKKVGTRHEKENKNKKHHTSTSTTAAGGTTVSSSSRTTTTGRKRMVNYYEIVTDTKFLLYKTKQAFRYSKGKPKYGQASSTSCLGEGVESMPQQVGKVAFRSKSAFLERGAMPSSSGNSISHSIVSSSSPSNFGTEKGGYEGSQEQGGLQRQLNSSIPSSGDRRTDTSPPARIVAAVAQTDQHTSSVSQPNLVSCVVGGGPPFYNDQQGISSSTRNTVPPSAPGSLLPVVLQRPFSVAGVGSNTTTTTTTSLPSTSPSWLAMGISAPSQPAVVVMPQASSALWHITSNDAPVATTTATVTASPPPESGGTLHSDDLVFALLQQASNSGLYGNVPSSSEGSWCADHSEAASHNLPP